MINFMCQLDWSQGAQINIISGFVCEGVSGWDEHLWGVFF